MLQRSIATLTRTDRTFLRPSRRQSALAGPDGAWPDVVSMPGRRILPAGKLVSVIDTSASIDAKMLARFLGALASIATAEGFDEIRLLQADAEVTRDETLFAAELYFQQIAIVGRGGTDFGPALRLLAAESKRAGSASPSFISLTSTAGFPAPPRRIRWRCSGSSRADRPRFLLSGKSWKWPWSNADFYRLAISGHHYGERVAISLSPRSEPRLEVP